MTNSTKTTRPKMSNERVKRDQFAVIRALQKQNRLPRISDLQLNELGGDLDVVPQPKDRDVPLRRRSRLQDLPKNDRA
jgi:hypothetical protein